MNIVENWFGDGFKELDPLLQNLHRNGGTLCGAVNVEYGDGLAGHLGARLATKMGIPNRAGCRDLTVKIGSRNGELVWSREFGDAGSEMVSIFKPQGHYPDGVWIERTGPITLILGVEVVNGGWYWVQRGAKIGPVRLPLWLMPITDAYKRVSEGRYEFSVTVSLPVLGMAFRYCGILYSGLTDSEFE